MNKLFAVTSLLLSKGLMKWSGILGSLIICFRSDGVPAFMAKSVISNPLHSLPVSKYLIRSLYDCHFVRSLYDRHFEKYDMRTKKQTHLPPSSYKAIRNDQ